MDGWRESKESVLLARLDDDDDDDIIKKIIRIWKDSVKEKNHERTAQKCTNELSVNAIS